MNGWLPIKCDLDSGMCCMRDYYCKFLYIVQLPYSSLILPRKSGDFKLSSNDLSASLIWTEGVAPSPKEYLANNQPFDSKTFVWKSVGQLSLVGPIHCHTYYKQRKGNVIQTNNSKWKFPQNRHPYFSSFLPTTSLQLQYIFHHDKFFLVEFY